jgi:hypothetical protein
MMESSSFPQRAFVQVLNDGGVSQESKAVINELKPLSIEIKTFTTEDLVLFGKKMDLTKNDLVVGDFEWTRMALKQLDIPMPKAPDYPECLRYLLHRKIWESTLAQLKLDLTSGVTKNVFIKPSKDIKAFSGLNANIDWIDYLLEQFPDTFPILCSDMIKMVSEYRVYVLNGEIKGVCYYQGDRNLQLSMEVVKNAIRTLFDSEEGKDLPGCAIDFAIIETGDDSNKIHETGLIEVNDGFSLGLYEGLSTKDYTDILIARWKTLLNN